MKLKTNLIICALSIVLLFALTVNADPVIEDFSLSSTTIEEGDSVTLSWNVTGADSVTINNGIGPVSYSGSLSVSPSASTSYVLTAVCSTCTPPLDIYSGGSDPGITITSAPLELTVVAAAPVTPAAPAAPTQTVAAPTMNEWGMIILVAFIGLLSVYRIRRMNQS